MTKEVAPDQIVENAITKKSSTTAKIEENRRNLKRMARAKTIEADNKIMDTIVIDNNLVGVVITDHLESQNLGGKRKGDDGQSNDIRSKKQKNVVDREASPKWLPSSQ